MDHSQPHPELYKLPMGADDFQGMPYLHLGRSGLRVSRVGLGTWKIGFPETGDGARVDERTALKIFDRAADLGVTFWDTANRYNDSSGNSERVIGHWFQQNPDQRRIIVLATKMRWLMDGRTPNHAGLSRGNILDSVNACLARLQLDYVDLLYFHGFDPSTPVEESLAAIEDLVSRDLVRYFAVSNFTVDQLELYRAVEHSTSVRCRMLAVQNQFDLLHGESERYQGVLKYAARAGISYVAWSPLARGLLTGRYLDRSAVGPGDRLYDEATVERDTAGPVMEKLQTLSRLAREWDLTLSQLALAYMLALPGMGPVIPSVSNIEQLESNAAAGQVVLSDEQKSQVREVLQT
jgi:aryl-alcohol dehydrogenase-like predicted oxidoreductase